MTGAPVPSLLDEDPAKLPDRALGMCEDVARHGFHVISVHPFADEPPPEWKAWEHVPAWHYTVGLWRTYGHPEFVAFALDNETAMAVFWDLAEAIEAGRRFGPNEVYEDALSSFDAPCAFEQTDGGWADSLFGQARWFYKDRGFPILQYLWPDQFGHRIWEPKAAESIRGSQPDLARPPAEPDAPPVLPRV